MKVTLVNPPYHRNIIRRWYCSVETNNYFFPPLELCYIGGILKGKRDLEVTLIDCIAENIDMKELKSKLGKIKPNMVVFMPGFQSMQYDIEVMTDGVENVDTKLVCFGHYPTLFAKEILKKFYRLDMVIKGEPEPAISELCYAIEKHKNREYVEGILFRDCGKIRETEDRKPVQNLDELPFPDRYLLMNEYYFSGFPEKKGFTSIMASRGCPFTCNYCIKSYGKIFRQRSVEDVLGEIEECVKKHKIKTFRFLDDTFTVNREWVIKFCDELIKREWDVWWSCLSRPDTLDKELLHKMKNSGCKQILVGIESGSQRILNYYNRKHDLRNIKENFIFMRKLGITSLAFFLIGAPIETKDDIKKSIEFAKEIDPDFIFVEKLTPIPGSYLFEKLKKEHKVKFSLFPYKVEYDSVLPREELDRELFKFYFSFYFRIGYVSKHFMEFLSYPILTLKRLLAFLDWRIRSYTFGYE